MSQIQITDLMGVVAAPLLALFVTLGIGICVNTCSLHIGCEKKSQVKRPRPLPLHDWLTSCQRLSVISDDWQPIGAPPSQPSVKISARVGRSPNLRQGGVNFGMVVEAKKGPAGGALGERGERYGGYLKVLFF